MCGYLHCKNFRKWLVDNDKIIILLIYLLRLIKENYASSQPKVLKGQPITYRLQVILTYQDENASLHTPKQLAVKHQEPLPCPKCNLCSINNLLKWNEPLLPSQPRKILLHSHSSNASVHCEYRYSVKNAYLELVGPLFVEKRNHTCKMHRFLWLQQWVSVLELKFIVQLL